MSLEKITPEEVDEIAARLEARASDHNDHLRVAQHLKAWRDELKKIGKATIQKESDKT